MVANSFNPPGKPASPVFNKVGQNFYRLETTGKYYALLKRGGKQFRRSLKTADRKLAERRLADLRREIGNLSLAEDVNVTFEELARRWLDMTRHTLKESSITRRETCIKNLAPFFRGVTVRNLKTCHCEKWLTQRGCEIAPQTFAHELGTMKAVFDYAVGKGLVLANPARAIKRKKITPTEIVVPSLEQYQKLIAAIRMSDGRPSSQYEAKSGADLVELLAYSGCRIAEATSLKWSDVSFERNCITVTGGGRRTKNYQTRTIPMANALRELLLRLQSENEPQREDFISLIKDAKKCLHTACRKLGFHQFTHHNFRHFFATTCIESGVDIPTISRWLGHKDGGALAMRIYGHLRQEHSFEMSRRVSFAIKPVVENIVPIPTKVVA